ncbi:hypothetical protein [Mesorhizobium carmichaelinearum]|uniref:hypothetical protein n=1 Tax=Mesorhizobium carmichaelinearum TaxID=1208188 RepID=UPI000BA3AF44|nr:hypothetical protein [Mesorhizobium carmichaelinearum]
MNEWNADIGDAWKAHIYAAGSRPHPIEFENIGSPRERLDFQAREFARAARDLDPLATDCWIGNGVGDNPQRFMVAVSRKGCAYDGPVRKLKPLGMPKGMNPREWRQSVEKRLNDLLDRAMSLITALDMMEVGAISRIRPTMSLRWAGDTAAGSHSCPPPLPTSRPATRAIWSSITAMTRTAGMPSRARISTANASCGSTTWHRRKCL